MKRTVGRGFIGMVFVLAINSFVLTGMDTEWTEQDERDFETLERELNSEHEEDKNKIQLNRDSFEKKDKRKSKEIDKALEQLQKEIEEEEQIKELEREKRREKRKEKLKNKNEKNETIQKKRERILEKKREELNKKQKNQEKLVKNIKSQLNEKRRLIEQRPIYYDLYPDRVLFFNNKCDRTVYFRWYFLDKKNQKFISASEKAVIEKNQSLKTSTPSAHGSELMYSMFIPYPIFSLDNDVLTDEILLKTIEKTKTAYSNGWSYYWWMGFTGRVNYNGKIGQCIIHIRDFTRSYLKKEKNTFNVMFEDQKNPETLTITSR